MLQLNVYASTPIRSLFIDLGQGIKYALIVTEWRSHRGHRHNAEQADVSASIWGLSFFAWLAYQFGTSKMGRLKNAQRPDRLTQLSLGERQTKRSCF
ncbi:hypothetical protein M5D96_001999 [Drosophila gunungcola]|uniref:Uncharacterized protein n=1 Tax=Drosophila gunungcola TaxID=103775 RepID=A0A9P9YZJ0_9MUSC|nr:hypothetical protein M5D96_001999 [Drosophila gunungcola]